MAVRLQCNIGCGHRNVTITHTQRYLDTRLFCGPAVLLDINCSCWLHLERRWKLRLHVQSYSNVSATGLEHTQVSPDGAKGSSLSSCVAT